MAQYWVVGATVDDQDLTQEFIDHGLWFADAGGAQDRIEQISSGDRIA